jgi:hypothetical protein
VLPEYLPDETKVTNDDAKPKARILPEAIIDDKPLCSEVNPMNCGVLSSGGKESLLTYGLLRELGCTVYPFYINESGGHWRTALTAYRYHATHDSHTQRIWTNIDRFYLFMLDHLSCIRSDHRKIWADTYPIRLCIFPVYIFILLPLFLRYHIGNLLIGSEFDDLRSQPIYQEIPHYYGVYDQHQDFDALMNGWYAQRTPGLVQWSAVRWISGLLVERILVNRYPQLAALQRSCHSCHFSQGKIVPCGSCSKCMGVLLFLLANKSDPTSMEFESKDIMTFFDRVSTTNLRLDQDEKDHSFSLLPKKRIHEESKPIAHIEQIHINDETCDTTYVPRHLRLKLFSILEKYTTGYCKLQDNEWIPLQKNISG